MCVDIAIRCWVVASMSRPPTGQPLARTVSQPAPPVSHRTPPRPAAVAAGNDATLLPPYALRRILAFLSLHDVLAARGVCSAWRLAARGVTHVYQRRPVSRRALTTLGAVFPRASNIRLSCSTTLELDKVVRALLAAGGGTSPTSPASVAASPLQPSGTPVVSHGVSPGDGGWTGAHSGHQRCGRVASRLPRDGLPPSSSGALLRALSAPGPAGSKPAAPPSGDSDTPSGARRGGRGIVNDTGSSGGVLDVGVGASSTRTVAVSPVVIRGRHGLTPPDDSGAATTAAPPPRTPPALAAAFAPALPALGHPLAARGRAGSYPRATLPTSPVATDVYSRYDGSAMAGASGAGGGTMGDSDGLGGVVDAALSLGRRLAPQRNVWDVGATPLRPRLRGLRLTNVRVTDAGLALIVSVAGPLQQLRVSGRWFVAPSTVGRLMKSLSRLLTLDVTGCPVLSDKHVGMLLRDGGCRATLRKFASDSRRLVAPRLDCPALESLCLARCSLLVEPRIVAPRLTWLSLAYCSSLTSDALYDVVCALPRLEYLDARGCDALIVSRTSRGTYLVL